MWAEPVSQDTGALRGLSEHYGVPVLSVHAPCLLVTQRVWGADPWAKVERSSVLAAEVGAETVVVHPPFRWQRDYAREFAEGVALRELETDVASRWRTCSPAGPRARDRPYLPGWDPDRSPTPRHAGPVARGHGPADAMEMADAGAAAAPRAPRRRPGHGQDEHLVPGRGPALRPLLESLAHAGYGGHIVLEINTRNAPRAGAAPRARPRRGPGVRPGALRRPDLAWLERAPSGPPRGRRRGVASDTRSAILGGGPGSSFAEHGFAGTTIRAGVDRLRRRRRGPGAPLFEGKPALFAEVMDLPVDPSAP